MDYAGPSGPSSYLGALNGMGPPNLFASPSATAMREPWQRDGFADGVDESDDDDSSLSSSLRRDQSQQNYYSNMHAPPPTSGRAGTSYNKPSSGISDFTKRKHWATTIVDEVADFLHVLGPSGNIVFASPSVGSIAGYKPEDLVGRQLDAFVHHDDVDNFNRDLRQSVVTGLPLRLHYRLRKKDGRYVIVEVLGHAYYSPGSAGPSVEDCKCVFVMGRPYPSRQAEEVDSFLELKLENEKLRQDLERLRTEVEADSDARTTLLRLKQAPRQDLQERRQALEAAYAPPSARPAQNKVNGAPDSTGRRRKKARTEEGEFVCRDCGTIDSPEWRKGPLGPKTLCNACGLRWAKKTKQMAGQK